jgi:hypothetical protein
LKEKLLKVVAWVAFIIAVIIAKHVADGYQARQAVRYLSEELLKGAKAIDEAR